MGGSCKNTHQNFTGLHFWWQPADALVKFRSEYAHGPHSQGYWMESEFHLASPSSGNAFRRAVRAGSSLAADVPQQRRSSRRASIDGHEARGHCGSIFSCRMK